MEEEIGPLISADIIRTIYAAKLLVKMRDIFPKMTVINNRRGIILDGQDQDIEDSIQWMKRFLDNHGKHVLFTRYLHSIFVGCTRGKMSLLRIK